ncbi:alpha/beta hydrolase family protein [Pseudomonas neustonica]|uniref:Alpha/beta hydrolase n=1 Tax=Pseudomonas neustonica TaxID=2487346 RepID=A0ABX9XHV8_9PSED|nr:MULTISPECIES: alpha/beta hydrolase [Pseudomonas]MAB23775.1 alpha/beta hydrolase [Pseudomonadales bacterium]MBA6421021.1 alpha/beta hydrolase [Pseudomonas sp. 5Ae-yellow]ROZ82762.1 alpha/beta hydrolase [Pseudomonas sp. SSM44]ROZ84714.1 alpha/beta hydrolase [Pseudomonas neustonica]|tara:strand:- start:1087 stop:1956 length:870 start_codon:yes stop_codon:yes gene_type:complete
MNRFALKFSVLTLGIALSSAALATNPGGGGGGSSDPTGTGFPGVTDFAASGSFTTTNGSAGFSCTVYRPSTLGANNLKHPIILWGNGTGASPSTYSGLLSHWASQGFVVAAANTSNAGTGEAMLDCLDYLTTQNNRTTGTYANKLDLNRVGTAGHSQGGGGTIMAGRDSRISATAPFQPYTIGLGHNSSSQSNQSGPMFLMSGSADTIASPTLNSLPVYSRANVPVFWGELDGASHFEPVGNAGDFRGPATAWFRYHLMEDQSAGDLFYGSNCALCTDNDWEVRRKGIN